MEAVQYFFSSDHHFGHANIIKFCDRPFTSVEEMDEELIKRWNEKVPPKSLVYYLGDFHWWRRDLTVTLEGVRALRARLNGEIILVRGNHDRAFTDAEWMKIGMSYVTKREAVFDLLTRTKIWVQHHPYSLNVGDPLFWKNFGPSGDWLLHGHAHEKGGKRDGRKINIGVDQWDFRPVSFDEIKVMMKEKK